MLPATRDIWQGHPASQAWKNAHSAPDAVNELHLATSRGDLQAVQVSRSYAAVPAPLHGLLVCPRNLRAFAGFAGRRSHVLCNRQGPKHTLALFDQG